MTKIYILGGSGSGKTTLAHELASRLHIPLYSLDALGEKNGNCTEAYIADAIAIAEQPNWVAEGIYLLWTDPLLYHADYIILLDIPWRVAAWRILYRHISKSLRGINPYPGLRPLITLCQDARRYYLNQHRAEPPTAALTRRCLAEQYAFAEPPTAASVYLILEKYDQIGIPPTAEFARLYLEKYGQKVWRVRNKADCARLLAQLTQS